MSALVALQAAGGDMGAVPGWVGVAKPCMASGRLVRLLQHQVTPREDFHVMLNARAEPVGALGKACFCMTRAVLRLQADAVALHLDAVARGCETW